MTLYNFIKSNKSVMNTLLKCGVVSLSVFNNLEIYQYYYDLRVLEYAKSLSITQTMNHFKVSQKTVYNVLNQFEEQI